MYGAPPALTAAPRPRFAVAHQAAVAVLGALWCLSTAGVLAAQPSSGPSHAIAYFGEPKYAADIPHFGYVNPDAPKGGEMRTWLPGTFNNLHPYVDKGRFEIYSTWRIRTITFDRLMMPSEDELSSLYCLLCETVEVAEDYSWVAYTLRPEARWHDGVPVTVDDVVWTYQTLKADGPVSFKAAWRHVEGIERLGKRSFRFLFGAVGRSRRSVMEASAFLTMPKHYWQDRDFTATTLAPPEELALLEPLREQIPERVFTHEFTLPTNDGYGRNREALLRAGNLLDEAGWVVRDFRRANAATGEPLRFEIMVRLREHERMLVPYVENLKRLGIEATVRRVESNIYTNRARHYDFELTMQKIYTHSIPQPARTRSHMHSESADLPNLFNYPGIRNPAVDALVEKVIAAETEEEMNIAGRALDRVLLWSFYVIPEGAPKGRHLLYWDRFGHPPLGREHMNWTGFPHLWWFDQEKSDRVDAALGETR